MLCEQEKRMRMFFLLDHLIEKELDKFACKSINANEEEKTHYCRGRRRRRNALLSSCYFETDLIDIILDELIFLSFSFKLTENSITICDIWICSVRVGESKCRFTFDSTSVVPVDEYGAGGGGGVCA